MSRLSSEISYSKASKHAALPLHIDLKQKEQTVRAGWWTDTFCFVLVDGGRARGRGRGGGGGGVDRRQRQGLEGVASMAPMYQATWESR